MHEGNEKPGRRESDKDRAEGVERGGGEGVERSRETGKSRGSEVGRGTLWSSRNGSAISEFRGECRRDSA